MLPVMCLVTDRTRFTSTDALVERVRTAARVGVHLVQVREPDLTTRDLLTLTGRCLEAVRATRARVLVNDRVDVALAAGAHGVHLRGDSMPGSEVRRIAPPGFLIGRSVHTAAEAREHTADGALDYLIFGSVFATTSKPGRAAAGPGALAAVSAAVSIPVLAIGGVTIERMPQLASAGASGFAAIGLFAERSGTSEQLQTLVRQASLAFDTLRSVP
jgi:thiamine-phosphate diphosphorylase